MAKEWIKLISKSLGDFVLTMVLWNSLFAIMQSFVLSRQKKICLKEKYRHGENLSLMEIKRVTETLSEFSEI